MKKIITVTIERNEDSFFAWVKGLDGCVAGGNSYDEVKSNLKGILNEFIQEDETLMKKYRDGHELRFEVSLGSFFHLFPEINISQLARLGGLNPGLLRQYASGAKNASERQAQKVMLALKELADRLGAVTVR